MGKSLVIVESPAKARTIEGYLGSDYAVGSSIGHVRDLPGSRQGRPRGAAEAVRRARRRRRRRVRAVLRRRPRQEEGHRRPQEAPRGRGRAAPGDGRGSRGRGDRVASRAGAEAEGARPPHGLPRDHEGRDRRARSRRRASIDDRLVDAQETRRILDRLYGYEVSPVLWKKVMPRLSAGRVQSVATRLVVDRERERMRFVAASYWDVLGTFEPGSFEARLFALDGKRIAQGRDFAEDGSASSAVRVLSEDEARALAEALAGRAFTVEKVDEKPYTRRPAAPFRTSTLQQEASRKLRFSSQTTMRVAQKLYENGHITYMRTDSVTLSDAALEGCARARGSRVRRGDRPAGASPLRARGGQRAGGARGDPSGRRRLPHARRAATRAVARRACAVRPRSSSGRWRPR